jgi:hypothetical protein
MASAPVGVSAHRKKYARGSSGTPRDSRRAAGNRARLTERNLKIAREVDAVADELGATSAQVAIAWLRQRGQRIIPSSASARSNNSKTSSAAQRVQPPADQLARLDKSSRIEFGFAYSLLSGPEGKVVHGDLRAASRPAGCGTLPVADVKSLGGRLRSTGFGARSPRRTRTWLGQRICATTRLPQQPPGLPVEANRPGSVQRLRQRVRLAADSAAG